MKNRLTSNLLFGLAAASFFAVSAFAQEAAPAAEAPAAAPVAEAPAEPLLKLRPLLLRKPLSPLRHRKHRQNSLSLPLLLKKKNPLNLLLLKIQTRAKWPTLPVTLSTCSRPA